ncbi:hypothetical protein ACKLNO_05145 [Neisseriaceae bacterium B1]
MEFIADLLLSLLHWSGILQADETLNDFFYHTCCVVLPLLSLGVFRAERLDNTQLLDWRTISIGMCETLGMIFWVAILCLLAGGTTWWWMD